jgi:hypothetical protein
MNDMFYEDDLEFHKACVKAIEQDFWLKRMDDAHKLLTLLMEAPDGITQHKLVAKHNFAPSLIYRLVEAELIRVRIQTIEAKSVFRFYISMSGRLFLKR